MRTLRLTRVSTLALAVLGGLTGSVVAQDDEDLVITATRVTGETTARREVFGGSYQFVDGVDQNREAVFEDTFDWSDPRLPSVMQLTENLDIHYRGDDQNAWAWVGSIRLEDADGAWTGREYGMGEWIGDGLVLRPRMMPLSGEGAYEGLSAMLQRRWETDDPTYTASVDGYIFEGELPPMPDAPPTE